MPQTCRQRSEQMKTKTVKLDYMPAELMEQILLKLPVKSLLRFSAVSKLWNSLIFRPEFAQSYRGREMIVLKSMQHKTLVCPLFSMSSDNPIDGTTPFDSPFNFPRGSLLASCGYLWCVKFEKSLLLYNPSIQTYRKLPNPESVETDWIDVYELAYGLGYDSVCDDYKILKIRNGVFGAETESEMYCLSSDCWRKVESQPPQFSRFWSKNGLFVSGALHWLVTQTVWIEDVREPIENIYILSFDLSEDKFGLIELPEMLLKQRVFTFQLWHMIVFGGKLRVCISCFSPKNGECHFSVWVMEDYESKLWTKEMEFDYGLMPPLCYSTLKPFYFYDDAGNLVKAVTCLNDVEKMFIYKEDDGSSSTPTLVEKNFGSNGFGMIDSFTYVESVVSPLTWHGSSSQEDNGGRNDN